MPVILKNNASSTLATAISASDTGIVVADGSKFPSLGASDYFYATLVSSGGTTEVVKVTARASNSMTVVRAQDGSSAASFASGALLEMRVNAASVTDLVRAPAVNNFTGNGSTVAYTLSSALGFGTLTDIHIDGVYQYKNTYTVSGTTLTFSEAPPLNAAIEVVVR
jgi:hypothetical protein